MKALDTNILVRFLIKDHLTQAEQVKHLLEDAEQSGEVFMITTPVILELIWVLASAYSCPRADILLALEQLSMLPILRFENSELIHHLISLGRTMDTDLPDILIGLAGQAAGCETTVTFDRRALRSHLFAPLS